MIKDQAGNLNPHAAARVAMWLYSASYAESRMGSMDFWDQLEPSIKRNCVRAADEIRKARPYTGSRR